eukprot:GILJ01004873.1.p1 GENE.GILJ01004873.1~~GILJ01004873.1.p1  ORF type:complete len:472 (+),score=60.90 GILJ01004873.1:38-1453(+)
MSLADSFLEDLEGLSDEEESDHEEGQRLQAMELDAQTDAPAPKAHIVSNLSTNDEFLRHMELISDLASKERTEPIIGILEHDPEYRVIIRSNEYATEIDTEILALHKAIRDIYVRCFPELESLVVNPLDYILTVKRIGACNPEDLTNNVDFSGVLPNHMVMAVTVTGAASSGQPLSSEDLSQVVKLCDQAIELDAHKQKILKYVESRMTFIAPNLSKIVGTSIAAKLMAVAGGLSALSKIPASNVQLLGSTRKALTGFSTATAITHAGFLYNCDVVQNAPPDLKMKAVRLLAGKCTLAARVDACHQDPFGGTGDAWRQEIERRLEKLQEPPPAKLKKALPVPDDKPRKKRGGKRVRRQKEKYVMTEMRKQQNRMTFGVEEEADFRSSGKGFGMIGASGSGRIRVQVKEQKHLLVKKRPSQSSGATSGLSSSIVFTPVQGLELVNPDAQRRVKEANDNYFSATGTFSQISRS